MKVVSFFVLLLLGLNGAAGPIETGDQKDCQELYKTVAGIDDGSQQTKVSHLAHYVYRHVEDEKQNNYLLCCGLSSCTCKDILSCSFGGVQFCKEDGHSLSLGPCGSLYDFQESEKKVSWKSCFGCIFGGVENLKGFLGMCGITLMQCDEMDMNPECEKL